MQIFLFTFIFKSALELRGHNKKQTHDSNDSKTIDLDQQDQ